MPINKTDSNWNLRRKYQDNLRTSEHIYKLRSNTDSVWAAWSLKKGPNVVLLETMHTIYPGSKSAVLAGGLLKEVKLRWMKSVANSLATSKNKGYCETLLDVNSFVPVYSSWNQTDT